MKAFLRIIFAQLFAYITLGAFAQQHHDDFTTPGTHYWTCPGGVTSITVYMWGAGGMGGIQYSGAGGNMTKSIPIPVTPGQTYQLLVGTPATDTNQFVQTGSYFPVPGGQYVTANGPSYIAGGSYQVQVITNIGWEEVAYSGAAGLVEQFNGGNTYVPAGGGSAASVCANGNQGTYATGTGTGGLGGISVHCAEGFWGGNGGDVGDNTHMGKSPGGGGGGGYPFRTGAPGAILIYYNCTPPATGKIGNGHTVTFPQEKVPDSITNIISPQRLNGMIIAWQQSTDNVNFVTAKTADTSEGYRFDQDSLKTTTYYRRGNNACLSWGTFGDWSDTVQIKVFTSASGRNGAISGKVETRNHAFIAGRKVYAQNLTPLKGRQVGFIDSSGVTDGQGNFFIDSIFYGDKDYGDSALVRFKVYADTTGGHLFNPSSVELQLSTSHPTYSLSDQPFLDTTVFALTGRVTQVCKNCLDKKGNTATITDGLDSVYIYGLGDHNSGSLYEKDSAITGYLSAANPYGSYAMSFQYADRYKVTPAFKNHQFKPVDSFVVVNNNVDNINFIDTTTHVISGFFGAGCNDYIGKAVLEFDDSLPVGYDSLPRGSRFRKQVKTDATGHYSIRLPARKYSVKIINTIISDPIDGSTNSVTVESFFESVADSLKFRDITLADTTLDLVYQRPPHLQVAGLIDSSAVQNCSAFKNYAIWPQGLVKPVTFNVFQGPVSRGCPLDNGSVYLTTDVTNIIGHLDKDTIPVVNGKAIIDLVGAQPNPLINGQTNTYSKYFSATYTDLLGRGISTDTINLPIIVVTGVAIDTSAKTFVTVSPQIPFLVLHDPPGNHSSSSWEQGVKSEQAISFEAENEASVGGFIEVKLGLDVILGIFLEQEDKFWGSINASVDISNKSSNTKETVITTTTTNEFSTSDDAAYVGPDNDLFYGSAMNIKYTEGNEVDWDSINCSFSKKPVLVFGPDGINTSFVYTLANIRDVQIPKLHDAAEAKPDSAEYFENQIKVWEQLLENNEVNKEKAGIDSNMSFSSGVDFSSSTTLKNSTTNTYEFNMIIDSKIATEVGVEIAGSGVKGGVSVGFKMTTGGSATTTNEVETTTGYKLSDNNPGDLFSVNIKKDPVYGTPMFETIAGESNCPHEANTVALDNSVITANKLVQSGLKKDTANFILFLGNLSIDPNVREYILFLDASSNPNGASVLIGGNSNPYAGVPFFIPKGGNQQVTVSIIRNSSSGVFNYDNLRFILTDNCYPPTVETFLVYPHQYSTINLSADFAAPVSNANLVTPMNNWLANITSNNEVAVTFNGYDTSRLSAISFQYNPNGTGTWKNAFTVLKSKLGNSTDGTTGKWRIAKVPDGTYNVRLMIQDKFNNIVYSPVAPGLIKRTPPGLFGIPQPSNGIYKTGTQISFRYTENINNTNLRDSMVHFKDMTTNTSIPVQLSAFTNTLIILPSINIAPYTGHLFRVIVDSVSDLYGNVRTTRDTAYFKVASTIFGTGSDALNVTVGVGSIYEDAKGSMDVHFTRNSPATGPIAIYYSLAGSAEYKKNFTVTYKSAQTGITGINGSEGVILLPKDSSQVTMYIHPVNDTIYEADKKLIITLSDGGGYTIGSHYSVTTMIFDHNLPPPVITASGPTTLCSGDSVILSTKGKINGIPVSLKWSTGATTTSITVKKSGTYTVKATENGFTGYSAPTVVTITCGSPTALTATVLNKSKAVLQWNAIGCAKKYCIKLRPTGTSTWVTDTLNSILDTVKGLLPNTTYEWQLASICRYPNIIISDFAKGPNFTTAVVANAITVNHTSDYDKAAAGDGFSASISPNPATTGATLEVKGIKGSYSIMIVNLQGKSLWKAGDITDSNVPLPTGILKPGVYMVVVFDKEHTGRLKLVKQ